MGRALMQVKNGYYLALREKTCVFRELNRTNLVTTLCPKESPHSTLAQSKKQFPQRRKAQ